MSGVEEKATLHYAQKVYLYSETALMVVLEIDILGGFVLPAKGDPVVPGYPYRPSFRFALQAVEVKAGDIHLLGQTGDFQQLQDANALPDMIGANPAGLAGEVNLFKPLVPERPDHSRSVDCLVYSVNPSATPVVVPFGFHS